MDKSDMLSILIYILVQTNVEDLMAQLVMIEDFISDKIKTGNSRLSATFMDLKNAVEFIVSLEKSQLEEKGVKYLQSARIDQISSNRFQYPESEGSLSQNTQFDLFGVGSKVKYSFAEQVGKQNEINGLLSDGLFQMSPDFNK